MDDLSIYSLSGENENNLSDLYNLLDSDSIEIGRLGDSKRSSPIKLSPTKNLKSDYYSHVTNVRSPTRPLQRSNGHFDNVSPVKFRTGHDTFEAIERNIDQYINNKIDSENANSDPFVDDLSQVLIWESHKLIDDIPASIASNQEGEKYIKLLRSCIEKVLKTVSSQQSQISLINRRNNDLKFQVNKLKLSQEQLQQQNSHLQQVNASIAQKNVQLKQSVLELQNDSGHSIEDIDRLQQENRLLRDKLIKYKNLYESVQSSKPEDNRCHIEQVKNKDTDNESNDKPIQRDETIIKTETTTRDDKAVQTIENSNVKQDERDTYNKLLEVFEKLQKSVEHEHITKEVGTQCEHDCGKDMIHNDKKRNHNDDQQNQPSTSATSTATDTNDQKLPPKHCETCNDTLYISGDFRWTI
jgi:cell division protein FtsB